MSEASNSSPSTPHAPSQPSEEESSSDPQGEESVGGEPVNASSEAPEPDDFPFHILGLCLALAWATAKYLDMPMRQMIFEYALPIFVITQIVRQGINWLRKSDRWSRGLESLRSTLDSYGGDFYGTVTFLTFLKLEFQDLEALWKEAPDAWAFAASLSIERLLYFGIDSIFNAIQAAFWPIQWFQDHGSDAWLLMALAWLLYKAALLILKPWLPERDPQKQPLGEFATSVEDLDLQLEALDKDLDLPLEALDKDFANLASGKPVSFASSKRLDLKQDSEENSSSKATRF